ncbi:MAG: hypothetical protein L3J39_06115 [Verrucomicrobiales bacterium]|nr:hypothetical protein [Verrucomicrobiales bacterium]
MKKELCPKCGELGKYVKRITLDSLLKEGERERMGAEPYFFCETTDCSVVYFDEAAQSVFEKEALTIRIGIKESEAPRQIC